MSTSTEPVVGIHLDLKYLAPSKSYLYQWVRQLPKLGINTLLIEYEDKFPYARYPFLRAADAFTPQQLRDWLAAARDAGLRLVPLMQSCSHLEFALAHAELAHLRELPHIITQIDTSNPDALRFVLDLMDEVMAYHQQDEWFHIGGDEAWHMGWNERTKAVKERLGELGMWAEHERKVLDHVVRAGKRPIVWDDALWKCPDKVTTLDFPRQTILHSWSYGVHYGAQHRDKLQRVNLYKAAGYEVLAAPCLNWGVLLPQHSHSLSNTAAWGDVVGKGQHLGIINTSWACFHTLPFAQQLYIAATARSLTAPQEILEAQWQANWLSEYFGAPAADVPAALETLGALWEHRVEHLARPITPVVYGYMDMVLWYRDIDHRRAEGAYPLDHGVIDFAELYQKKLTLLRTANADGSIRAKLDELIPAYEQASSVLTAFAQQATQYEDEAKYLAWSGRMKAVHTRILHHQIVTPGTPATVTALRQAWNELAVQLDQTLAPLADELVRARMRRMWIEPIAASL